MWFFQASQLDLMLNRVGKKLGYSEKVDKKRKKEKKKSHIEMSEKGSFPF